MSLNLKPVSIVIPIKNRAYFLGDLIKNLSNLKYPRYEIIIVDDGSEDNTKEELKKYPIRFISLEKSIGSGKARNLGIKNARYEIIALTDSDCFVSSTWLKDLVPYLERYDVVGGKITYLNKEERKLNPTNSDTEIEIKNNSPVNFLNTSNMVLKKEIISFTGGFLNYRLEDLEFS